MITFLKEIRGRYATTAATTTVRWRSIEAALPFTFGEKFVQLSTPLPSSSFSLLLYFSSLFRLCALLTKSTMYYGYEAVSKAAKRRHVTPPPPHAKLRRHSRAMRTATRDDAPCERHHRERRLYETRHIWRDTKTTSINID